LTIQVLCFVAACGRRSFGRPWPSSQESGGVAKSFVVRL
jgi:hypothetical protein